MQDQSFPTSATTALPVFYRTYARKEADTKSRESVSQVKARVLKGLFRLGNFTEEEQEKISQYLYSNELFTSGRFLWCGGLSFSEKPKNYYALYNCSSITIESWKDLESNFNFLMQGNGSGAKLEYKNISKLPKIRTKIKLRVIGEYGSNSHSSLENTTVSIEKNKVTILVGDSRLGWCSAYRYLLELASQENFEWDVTVDVSNVRRKGERIKGFGGITNPTGFIPLLNRVVEITNSAVGRWLTPLEVSLLLNEAAKCTVAGNVRRSARIDQFSKTDIEGGLAKQNLWSQNSEGNWSIDPKKDSLRMANFTRVWHEKPTYEEVREAVTSQFHSGEGAIQFAPEAIARANVDLLDTETKKAEFIKLYCLDVGKAFEFLSDLALDKGLVLDDRELDHRLNRYGLNPCLTGDMKLLTNLGYLTFEELSQRDDYLIVASNGEMGGTKVWYTGEKEVLEIRLSNRQVLKSTPDHRWMTTEGEEQAKNLKGKKLTPYLCTPATDSNITLWGFIQGDGNLTRLKSQTHKGLEVNIGEKDSDVLKLFNDQEWEFTSGDRTIYLKNAVVTAKSYGFSNEPLPSRVLPDCYNGRNNFRYYFGLPFKASFLRGLYSANGCVLKKSGRVVLKTTCLDLAEEVQESLFRDFEIDSYITTNKPKLVEFSNGSYQCKTSYDLNIGKYEDKVKFFNTIGFIQKYKTELLAYWLLENAPTVTSTKNIGVQSVYDFNEPLTNWSSVEGYLCHNCGEIIGSDFFCNLVEVHLNQLSGKSFDYIQNVFYYAGLQCAALLSHEFDIEKFKQSRELDPIVGVSFTGLFDFFANKFGKDWLDWWSSNRNEENGKATFFKSEETRYLSSWKASAEKGVKDYCEREGLKVPNRSTTVQPAGSKSLLTGASPGWHPPKSPYFIRRITFAKNDPVALACIDYGYSVVPSQSDKDENGNLLNDPFDSRCTEWLVEIPVKVSWASLEGSENVRTDLYSVNAQFDFYMQVQRHYTAHNTSATIEFREHEIDDLSDLIHHSIQNNKGYISAALLPRFDSNSEAFPRLPFEPISKEIYEKLIFECESRRKSEDFYSLLLTHDTRVDEFEGPAGCDSDKCLLPLAK